jgi:Nup93/Nic96
LERGLPLLKLDKEQYFQVILRPAAKQSEREKRTNEAIKLYNLAESPDTVIACLARALSELVDEPDNGGELGMELAQTARDILRHYERTNKGAGKAKDAVVKLLKIRTAREAKEAGNLDAALQVGTQGIWKESSHIEHFIIYTPFRQLNRQTWFLSMATWQQSQNALKNSRITTNPSPEIYMSSFR